MLFRSTLRYGEKSCLFVVFRQITWRDESNAKLHMDSGADFRMRLYVRLRKGASCQRGALYDSCNQTDIYMGTEYSTEHFPMDLLYFAIFSGITSYFVIYSCRMLQEPWSDVYAFAATIYKCVTGVTPPESMERMREDDLKRPWEFGVAISPQVEAALVKGMAAYG